MAKEETGMHSTRHMSFPLIVLLATVALYIGILTNIQPFRVLVGFSYLLLVPGIVLIRLFKLKHLSTSEKMTFSVCLSLVFVMGVGLLLNTFAPHLGFTAPLSTDLTLVSISLIILPLSFLRLGEPFEMPKVDRPLIFLILIFAVLFVCGVLGIFQVTAFEGSNLILLLIFAIALIVCGVFISEKLFPPRLYPLILLVLCMFLLLFVTNDTALFTPYITGRGDQYIEFQAFKSAEMVSRWNPAAVPSYRVPTLFPTYSMLSVTIMPTIFQRITGIGSSWIFKLLYPLIVCFMALGVYSLSQVFTKKKIAFLATFFFITVSVGKGWGSDKQLVAQLFMVALFLLIFKKDVSRFTKNALFIIFSAGLVVSHYSLSYIFMITLLLTWLILTIRERMFGGTFSSARIKLPFDFVIIYLTMALSWAIFVNFGEAFNILVRTAETVASSMGQFFDLSSRGTALVGLGLVETPTIFNRVSAGLFLLTEGLLFLGFLWIVLRKEETNFTLEFRIIAALNVGLIAINLILPRLADTFLMERFYQTSLIVLASLAIIGGKVILERIPKLKQKHILPIIAIGIFVPLFLFQTGFVYEVAETRNASFILSIDRWDNMDRYDVIVDSRSVSGAYWLSDHINVTRIVVVSDSRASYGVLTSYALLGRGLGLALSNNSDIRLTIYQYIFMRPVNVIDGEIATSEYTFNSSEIDEVFQNENKVYSNGGCEIYVGHLMP